MIDPSEIYPSEIYPDVVTRAEFDALKVEIAAVAARQNAPYPVWDVIHADYAKRDAAIAALRADLRTLAAALRDFLPHITIRDARWLDRFTTINRDLRRIAKAKP